MKFIAGVFVVSILNYIIILSCIDFYLMGVPRPLFQFGKTKNSFMIQNENCFEMQENLECSGFSTAYVLRHFGFEADGIGMYHKMKYKFKDGCVFAKSIPKVLAAYGIKAKYYIGNFTSLKKAISKGNPVIVLVRYEVNKPWLHYLSIVGYDNQYVYAAESLKEKVNCEEGYPYNRKIPVKEFKRLWNTSMLKMPMYRNTFIVSEKM